MLTLILRPGIKRCICTTKHIVSAACFALLLLAVALGQATESEPEICKRAKALGYDESKDVLLTYPDIKIDKRKHCTRRFWYLFQPKPLTQTFNEDEYKQYDQAIKQGECKQAAEILSKRFDAAHPGAPPHRSDSSDRLRWELSMSHHYYDSLGLCSDLRSLHRALKDIDAAGLKPRPFWNLRENYIPGQVNFEEPVRRMYSAVGRLLTNMGRTQSQNTALAVLKISNEGRALKLHPHYEIYVAHRLRELGMSDPVLDEIINQPLDPDITRAIAEKANRKDPSGLPTFPQDQSNLGKPEGRADNSD